MADDGLGEESVEVPLENDELIIYTEMSLNIVGESLELYHNKAVVQFTPTEHMAMDQSKLIHAGFVFNAAMAVINKKYNAIIAHESNS